MLAHDVITAYIRLDLKCTNINIVTMRSISRLVIVKEPQLSQRDHTTDCTLNYCQLLHIYVEKRI